MPCFYDQPTCSSRLTREHVISAAVLKVVYGEPIRNIARSTLFGKQALVDHQATVRDVCQACNNEHLSGYDVAGVDLVRQIAAATNAENLPLAVSQESMGWLLKTHLNFMRVFRDVESGQVYPIHRDIKRALVTHNDYPHELTRLFVEGISGELYLWNVEDPRHISWINYRSVRFRSQRIVVSELRLKLLTTLLLFPADANYAGYNSRVWAVIEEMEREFASYIQPVDTRVALASGRLVINRSLKWEELKHRIRRH